MPFDALTLAAVRQELETKYTTGRIQGLLLAGPLALSLELYRSGTGRSNLVMSAHPQHARIHLSAVAPTRDPGRQPPLLLLLRKYVRGGTLLGVSQPSNERVLALSIAKRISTDKHQEYHSEDDFRPVSGVEHDEDEEDADADDPFSEVVTVQLVVEIMGRLSNIILVDEAGKIVDSIKRVPSSINRYREVLPHHPYVLPPPQDKRNAFRASINLMSLEMARAAQTDPKVPEWKALVSAFAGVSPTLAREATFRALGAVGAPASEVAAIPAKLTPLLAQLQSLLATEESSAWQPSVAWKLEGQTEGLDEEERPRKPSDFAPYQLTHLEAAGMQLEQFSSISAAITKFFASQESLQGHSALKEQVAKDLDEMRRREDRKMFALREEWAKAQALEELRRRGEMLLGYMHYIEPGQSRLIIPEENLTIELEPGVTPVEQAQAIFREYRKAQSAHVELPQRMEQVERQREFLDEILTSLDLASTYDEIKAVHTEVKALKSPARQIEAKSKSKGKQAKLPQPLRVRTRSGATLLVGRTAGQNEAATFRLSDPEDIWLHARGAPGSHVVLKTGGGIVQADIQEAAEYAAGYSKLRNEAYVDVIWTEKKFVRRVPNAPPGFVTYKNERVIRVAPKQRVTANSRS